MCISRQCFGCCGPQRWRRCHQILGVLIESGLHRPRRTRRSSRPFCQGWQLSCFPTLHGHGGFSEWFCLGSCRFQSCTHRNVIPAHRKGHYTFLRPREDSTPPFGIFPFHPYKQHESTGEFGSGNSCLLVRRMAYRLSVCFTASYHTRCPHLPFFQPFIVLTNTH